MEKCQYLTCCRKGYTMLMCKCEKVFCPIHRGEHGCEFNYRLAHERLLTKQNPKVEAPKLKDSLFSDNKPQ